MQTPTHTTTVVRSYVTTSIHPCPQCHGPLMRMPRRIVDRAWSLFQPVQRFRCNHFACQWSGNFPTPPSKTGRPDSGQGTPLPALLDNQPERLPRTFIVSMVLTALGLVGLVVLSQWDFAPEPYDVTPFLTEPRFDATTQRAPLGR